MNELAFRMISGAPNPVAPFSHAVETGDWAFLTGQIPQDPENDDAPLPPDIASQTHQTMENIKPFLPGWISDSVTSCSSASSSRTSTVTTKT